MPDTIRQCSLHYLYGQLRKARIAMGKAEERGRRRSAALLLWLCGKLEGLIGIVIKGG